MSGFYRFLLWSSILLGALGAFLYFAFFDVWRLPADDPQFAVSVEPTLSSGDIVLLARHGTPSTGNLVRCTDPDEPRRWVVGRWVASAGDKVVFDNENLLVNGAHFASPRGCGRPMPVLVNPASGAEEKLPCRQVEFAGITHEILTATEHAEGLRALTVDPNKVVLVSDNRHMHQDSRDFGSIDPASCEHIVFRLWGAGGYMDASRRFTIIW
jgi:signal peptidase I